MADTKTSFQKELELEKKKCDETVREWEAKLKEATSQLEYWKRQQEALLTINTRFMFDGWKK